MKTVTRALVIATAAVVVVRVARHPRTRAGVHAALGRPIVQGVRFDRGTLHIGDGVMMNDCHFEGSVDVVDNEAIEQAIADLTTKLWQAIQPQPLVHIAPGGAK